MPDAAIPAGFPHILIPAANAQIDTAQSKIGNASLLFDGSDDYWSSLDSDTWDFGTSPFTLEFWVRFASVATPRMLVSHGGVGDTDTDGWSLHLGSGPLLGWRYKSGASLYDKFESWSPLVDTWYHVAVCRDASNNLRMFIDGSELGSTTADYTHDISAGSEQLRVGSAYDGYYDFSGWIDELRISSIARYTSNFTPPTTPLHPAEVDEDCVLLLHLDGANSTTWAPDYALGGEPPHNVGFVGTAQLDTAQYRFGPSSLRLDGNSDYLTIPDSPDYDFGTGDFTIGCWLRYNALPSSGNGMVVYDHWESSNDYHNVSLRNNAGTYQFRIRVRQSSVFVLENTFDAITVNTGTWYHFALSRDGNTFRMFWDGVAAGSVVNAVNITGISGTWQIGRYHGAYDYHNGWIDEFRILKGRAEYTSDFTPPSSKLVQYAGGTSSSSSNSESLSSSSSSSSGSSSSFSSSSSSSGSASLSFSSSSSSESASLSSSSSSKSSSSSESFNMSSSSSSQGFVAPACPEDCTDAPNYEMTLSGFADESCPYCNCQSFNSQVFSLTKDGGSACSWQDGSVGVNCTNPVRLLNCTGSQWKLTMYNAGATIATWYANNEDGTPPLIGWELEESESFATQGNVILSEV